MYYLRYFKTQAEAIGQASNIPTVAMVEGVDKVGYFDGDTSKLYTFTADGNFIKIEIAKLVCTYNVTSTTSATQLLYESYDLSNIASMEVDGVDTMVANTYKFSTKGKHTVKFTLKDGVTSIGSSAFGFCTELTSITIPDGVTSIEYEAFTRCSSLTSVVIPNSVTSIGAWAFDRCTALTSVVIPNSVTALYANTFYNCTALTSVVIPNSVTSIGNGPFRSCSSLTSITIPDSVTSIGNDAFSCCSSLTSITISKGISKISKRMFYGCGLTSVTIPDSVTSILEDAFYKCRKLTSISYTGTVAQWKNIFRYQTTYSSWKTAVPATTVTCSDGICGLDDK